MWTRRVSLRGRRLHLLGGMRVRPLAHHALRFAALQHRLRRLGGEGRGHDGLAVRPALDAGKRREERGGVEGSHKTVSTNEMQGMRLVPTSFTAYIVLR